MEQKGFSILEVMMAISVVAATALGGAQLLTTKQKQLSALNANLDAESIGAIITAIRSQKEICRANFQNLRLPPASKVSVPGLRLSPTASFVLKPNEFFQETRVRVDKIELERLFNLDLVDAKPQVLARFTLDLSWPNLLDEDRTIEEHRRERTFQADLPLILNGNRVDDCNVASAGAATDSNNSRPSRDERQEACESLGWEYISEISKCMPSELYVSADGSGARAALAQFKEDSGINPHDRLSYIDRVHASSVKFESTFSSYAPHLGTRRRQQSIFVGPSRSRPCFEDGTGCPSLRVRAVACNTRSSAPSPFINCVTQLRPGGPPPPPTRVSCGPGETLMSYSWEYTSALEDPANLTAIDRTLHFFERTHNSIAFVGNCRNRGMRYHIRCCRLEKLR